MQLTHHTATWQCNLILHSFTQKGIPNSDPPTHKTSNKIGLLHSSKSPLKSQSKSIHVFQCISNSNWGNCCVESTPAEVLLNHTQMKIVHHLHRRLSLLPWMSFLDWELFVMSSLGQVHWEEKLWTTNNSFCHHEKSASNSWLLSLFIVISVIIVIIIVIIIIIIVTWHPNLNWVWSL